MLKIPVFLPVTREFGRRDGFATLSPPAVSLQTIGS